VRRRFGRETRTGRTGDALLDLLYATPFVAGGLLLAVGTWISIANGPDDDEALVGFGLAILLFVPGVYFVRRAVRGR
jgi:hypothetical protein